MPPFPDEFEINELEDKVFELQEQQAAAAATT